MKRKNVYLAIGLGLALSGCQSLTDGQKTALGALGGAAVGGVIGHQVHDERGRYVGAVLGALAGGTITHYMNQQQSQLEDAVSGTGITVTRIDDSTIKLNIPNAITFDVNQANLKPTAQSALTQVAGVINQYPETAVHVLGFADSTGQAAYNLDLSQQRATSAGNYLASQGVVSGRIVARGYGEQFPIASNDNEAGRAQNRRVEVFIRAIQQGNEQAAYSPIY
ncbi:OmpA family protein [Ostreibacterium oceani]|uniref:OmpA family protein n=1 Tax=Ostreibacterium oceani TaxID=2654998 RepID=A0A6N7EVM9_9GAMM|nr:OmpA family protein [Ostreibacterium oceani]MPV85600.1 OmpA family protein [Ostreibacterium oceani]